MRVNEGVIHKPEGCRLCKLSFTSTGFCPDFAPSNPKLMMLLERPFSSDVIEQEPMSGSMGRWFYMNVLKPSGLRKEDILLSHVLRCKAKKYPKNNLEKVEDKYPVKALSKIAENNCRVYDRDIKQFDPEIFVYTYGIMDTFKDPAFLALLLEDIKKALRLSKQGRVCLLMGENPVRLFDPTPFKNGKGGLRQWRGNYMYSKWRY